MTLTPVTSYLPLRRAVATICLPLMAVAVPSARAYAQDTLSDLDSEGWPRNRTAMCRLVGEVLAHGDTV
jgi:hypothetical protein